MNPYRYKISLRLRHPSLDPAEITSALHLSPSRSWRAGDSRTTPTGKPLEGKYPDTTWIADVGESKWPDKELPVAINGVLDQLAPYKEFFHRIRSEGGKVEFFVGWFLEGQGGDIFDCGLLARMADLKIDLALDVYPDDAHLPPEGEVDNAERWRAGGVRATLSSV
jgi:hypothetical protein